MQNMEEIKSSTTEAIDCQDHDFFDWENSSEADFLISYIERNFQSTDMSAPYNEVYNDHFMNYAQSAESCAENVEKFDQDLSEFYKLENLRSESKKSELRDDFTTLECNKLISYASSRGERIICSPILIQGENDKSRFQGRLYGLSSSDNHTTDACIPNHTIDNVGLIPKNSYPCSIVKNVCDTQDECVTRNQTVICNNNQSIGILNVPLQTSQNQSFNIQSQNCSVCRLNISTHKITNNERLIVSAHDHSAIKSVGTSNQTSFSSQETDILEDTTGYQRMITSSQENSDSQKMITSSQENSDSQKMITSSQENSDSQIMITSSQENSDSQIMITSSQENSDSQIMITSSQENSDSQIMITSSQENSDGLKMITSSQEMITSSQEISDSQIMTISSQCFDDRRIITSNQESLHGQKRNISSQERCCSQGGFTIQKITSAYENLNCPSRPIHSQSNYGGQIIPRQKNISTKRFRCNSSSRTRNTKKINCQKDQKCPESRDCHNFYKMKLHTFLNLKERAKPKNTTNVFSKQKI